MSLYDTYQKERDRLGSEIANQPEIENSIKKQLKKNMEKNWGNYFDLDDILGIKEIKKHFSLIIITGDRNIGKTTSMRNYVAERYNQKGEKYVWLRTLDKTAEEVLTNSQSWFESKGWSILKKDSEVIVKKNEKQQATINNRLDTIGYYLGLKNVNSKKSIDFPKVSTIIMDEFNDGLKIKNKFGLLTSFATTAFRYRKNTKIIMSANFINQADSILATLGMKQGKGKAPMLTFNWIARAVIWNIPKGNYQKTGATDTQAYRMAVAGGINLYRQEYGGDFNNKQEWNIKELTSFVEKKDICYFLVGERKLVYGKSIRTNEYYVVDYEKRPQKKLREIVFTNEDFMKYKNATTIKNSQYKILKHQWKMEKLFTDEVEVAETMIRLLAGEVSSESIVKVINQ